MSLVDVLIVGAGSAGLMCASRLCYYAKIASRDINILLIDSNSKIGKKLAITGNGRCNITNSDFDCNLYNSDSSSLVNEIYSSFNNEMTLDFFTNELGLLFSNKNNLVYPYSYKSSSVIDSFKKYLSDNKVEIIFDSKVVRISKNELFQIDTDSGSYYSKNLVIATGGSSYKATGSDGSGFKLLASMLSRQDFTRVRPSLIQLTSNETDLKVLSGSRFNCSVSLCNNESNLFTEDGELLFTDNGISGICVMQLSRYVISGKYSVIVDFMPEFSHDFLNKYIGDCFLRFPDRTIIDALGGIVLPDLIEVIIKRLGSDGKRLSKDSHSLIPRIIKMLKEFRISISGTEDFDKAQVTAGGLNLANLSGNLETRVDSLYACGEVLNVDGPCGGYNLQWAWSSADAVARGIIRSLYGV